MDCCARKGQSLRDFGKGQSLRRAHLDQSFEHAENLAHHGNVAFISLLDCAHFRPHPAKLTATGEAHGVLPPADQIADHPLYRWAVLWLARFVHCPASASASAFRSLMPGMKNGSGNSL